MTSIELFCFGLSSIFGALLAGRGAACAFGSIPVRRMTNAKSSSPDIAEYRTKLSYPL